MQFVAGDHKRALLFSLVPIRERGVVDAEGEAFVGLIDGISADMGQGASNPPMPWQT